MKKPKAVKGADKGGPPEDAIVEFVKEVEQSFMVVENKIEELNRAANHALADAASKGLSLKMLIASNKGPMLDRSIHAYRSARQAVKSSRLLGIIEGVKVVLSNLRTVQTDMEDGVDDLRKDLEERVLNAMSRGKSFSGVFTVNRWRFDVLDASKLPREYMAPNLTAIREAVARLGEDHGIEGVVAWQETSLVIRE